MEDEKLLRLLRKDPNKGMEKMIDLYTGVVSAVVKGRLAGFPYYSADIEDCVADTFIKFYEALDSYDPGTACIRTYLCVIARNTAANLTRRMHPVTTIDDEEAPVEISDTSFTDEIAARDTLDDVLDAVRALGEPDSDIILRKYYVGQTSKEIAGDLGMTVSNVDTRAHRAIGKLRTIFGGI